MKIYSMTKKYLTVILVIGSFFLPQFVLAQATVQTEQCDELRKQFENGGGGDIVGSLPVYCSTGSVYTKFLNLALYAAGIAAVIAIIYGGYLYMTAAGNDAQRTKGKTVLTWAIVGVIVIVTAALIVNIVITAIVENRFV